MCRCFKLAHTLTFDQTTKCHFCSIPGRLPEVFFYDAEGKEVDKMFIEKLSFPGESLWTGLVTDKELWIEVMFIHNHS